MDEKKTKMWKKKKTHEKEEDEDGEEDDWTSITATYITSMMLLENMTLSVKISLLKSGGHALRRCQMPPGSWPWHSTAKGNNSESMNPNEWSYTPGVTFDVIITATHQ